MKRLFSVVPYRVVFVAAVCLLATGQEKDENVKFSAGLPHPTGNFPVGFRRFEWADHTRRLTADLPRIVVVSVFYPTTDRSGKRAEYFPAAKKLPRNDQTESLRDDFGRAWNLIASDALQSDAIENGPIVPGRKKLPVLLFSPGLGMPSAAYSVQLADFASHGYVVVAIDHPNDAPLLVLSNGTLISFDKKTWSEQQPPGPPTLDGMKFGVLRQEDWADDSGFVIRELRSRSKTSFFSALDLTLIGAFGHSMGGAVAARLCQSNSSVQACIDEDGELFGHTLKPTEVVPALNPKMPLAKPLLVISLVEPSMKQIPQYMQVRQASRDDLAKFLDAQTCPSFLVEIDKPDMAHMSFADIPMLYDNAKRPGSLQLNEFTRSVAIAFFDQFLRGSAGSLGKALSHNGIGSVSSFPQ